jgi:hypothetical protein
MLPKETIENMVLEIAIRNHYQKILLKIFILFLEPNV